MGKHLNCLKGNCNEAFRIKSKTLFASCEKKKRGGGGKNIEDFHDFQKIDLCTVSLLRINIKGL